MAIDGLQDLVGSYAQEHDNEKMVVWAGRFAGVNYSALVLWVVVGTWFLIAVRVLRSVHGRQSVAYAAHWLTGLGLP